MEKSFSPCREDWWKRIAPARFLSDCIQSPSLVFMKEKFGLSPMVRHVPWNHSSCIGHIQSPMRGIICSRFVRFYTKIERARRLKLRKIFMRRTQIFLTEWTCLRFPQKFILCHRSNQFAFVESGSEVRNGGLAFDKSRFAGDKSGVFHLCLIFWRLKA